MSEAPLKVEERILHKTVHLVPEVNTHFSRPAKEIKCRKDVVGLDYAQIKCTRDEQAQDFKTEVEEGVVLRELTTSEKHERALDPLLNAETQEAYRRAIREATPLKETMPYHKEKRKWVSDPYPSVDTCVRFIDRYHLECLRDNVQPAMEPCEKVEALTNCAKDTAFSPAVAASIVDVPHEATEKCLLRLEEAGKVFKTAPQRVEPRRAVCAGEREFQWSERPV